MNNSIDALIEQQRKSYEDEVILSVDAFIGRPSELQMKQAKTKFQKKEAKINFDYHKKLYDMLVNFFIENGEIGFKHKIYLEPQKQIENLYNLMSSKFGGISITPSTMLMRRRPRAVYMYLKNIIDRTKGIGKFRKRVGIPDIERAAAPPSLVAAKTDRFGIVARLIESAQRLSDNVKQSTLPFESAIETIRIRAANNIVNLIKGETVNLNNASMDGIYGFRDRDHKKVILIGESKDSYTVIYEDDPDRVRTRLKKDDVNISQDGLNIALIEKYRDEFFNDLLHGQARYIVPSTIPTTAKARVKWLKSDDGKAVSDKLRRMERYGDINVKSPDVRTVNYKGVTYHYVMVKQGEESIGESYNAYLIMAEEKGKADVKTVDSGYDPTLFKEALKEGFYRSEVHMSVSPKLTKRGNFIKGSVDKRWQSFVRMPKQPQQNIMDDPLPSRPDEGIFYNSIWEQLLVFRTEDTKIGIDMKSRIGSQETNIQSMLNRLARTMKIKGHLSKERIQEIITSIEGLGGVESRVMVSKDGTIHTANSYFTTIGENYGPVSFHKRERAKFIDQIRFDMRERKMQMADELTDEEMKALDADIAEANEYARMLAGLDDTSTEEYRSRLVYLQTAVHTKHRTASSDLTKRRKDDRVHPEYLDRNYTTFARNDLIAEVVDGVEKLTKLVETPELLSDEIDYLINRVKMTMGDPDTKAGYGKLQLGNQEIADKINSIKKKLNMSQDWDAAGAQKLFLKMNALVAMVTLGSRQALGNRTQNVNEAIVGGWPLLVDAWTKYKTPYWQGVINNTGLLNIVFQFQDFMMGGQDVKITDAGLVTHPLVTMGTFGFSETIPTRKFVHWIKIWRLGRDKFINDAKNKKGEKWQLEIYEWLMRLAGKGKGMISTPSAEGLEKLDIEYLAELYWDLFFATQDEQTEELTTARIKALVGEISETRLKKMVSWKLSYHFSFLGEFGKEFFTFTGGEKANRGIGAVFAIMMADENGSLGDKTSTSKAYDNNGKEVSVRDRHLSDAAVNMARNAVYATQFGMNQLYLGEMFGGAGKSGLQFKSFPYQQVIRDFNTFDMFMKGSGGIWGVGDMTARLIRTQGQIMSDLFRVWMGDKTYKFSPGRENIDQEARSLIRILGTRTMASIIVAFTEIGGLVAGVARIAAGRSGFGMMRSMENPIFGLLIRYLMFMAFFAGDWDDDEDEKIKQFLEDISRLLIPVFVSLWWQGIKENKEMIEEDEIPGFLEVPEHLNY
tara:strand:+ start:486 stop:4211 length:3726 start_codon:yes stop_codon:yes gene_type:complete